MEKTEGVVQLRKLCDTGKMDVETSIFLNINFN